ncbi:hypothetical protein HRI_000685000 [Hibiscus trionum]|uniref:DUF659 domain-containing protein n=1 Tax=Hibiscus trionum TaxID=183268 RepID=A0A9W7LMK3_HIBTR|nr:hypothetical protein HRI_000685000 [Hibiscus trionum]
MVFGKKRQRLEGGQSQNQSSPTDGIHDIEEENYPIEVEEVANTSTTINLSASSSTNNCKPLLDEVTFTMNGTGRNPGGAKRWICNHCKKSYNSSYSRIHQHFFGPGVGKKSEVARCQTLLTNRAEFQRIRKKVEEAENASISPSLSKSTLNNSHSRPTSTTCPIAKSFGTVERHQVDILIVRALCANGIPFNVLRNPDFLVMLKGVNQAPKDYKPPSFDRARTTLVDECQRQLEKELTPVKDTWTTQGTSIVSDGWTNVKRQPLINVVASNSCGSMFMYAKDFTGQEKIGKNIAEFLLESIEEVGPSNVLQVVTDNAANCKAAGKEIEKILLPHFYG